MQGYSKPTTAVKNNAVLEYAGLQGQDFCGAIVNILFKSVLFLENVPARIQHFKTNFVFSFSLSTNKRITLF